MRACLAFLAANLTLSSIVLECDSSQIASRVSLVGAESGQNAPFSEQSLSQALQSAKIFSRALLK